MADSESGSPDSYSSFLVTIRLSRLVSDRQTDGWTDGRASRTITIAGPLIVGGPANKDELIDLQNAVEKFDVAGF